MPRNFTKKFVFTDFMRTVLHTLLILKIMMLLISPDMGVQCAKTREANTGNYINNPEIATEFFSTPKSLQNPNRAISARCVHYHKEILIGESVLKQRHIRNIKIIRHKDHIQAESLEIIGQEESKSSPAQPQHKQDVDLDPGNDLQTSAAVTDRSNLNNAPSDKDLSSIKETISVDRRGKQHQHLHRLQQLSALNGGVNGLSGGNSNSVFATENNTVVMAQIGGTATLPCVVRKFNNGVVSWIRRQDYHLLTVGLTTYNADGRFLVEHIRHLQNWGLLIKHVQPSDEGLYECQVSTHPPTSVFVELKVTEASAYITGAPDLHLRSGSTLRLLCTLRQSTEPPAYVFWYHQHRMINYDVGVNVSRTRGGAGSILVVHEADKSHNGNYTCSPSNAVPASINVHVLNATAEEQPAAMQHANTSSTSGVANTCSAKFSNFGNLTLLLLSIITIIVFHNNYIVHCNTLCVENKKSEKAIEKKNMFRVNHEVQVEKNKDICDCSKKCEKTMLLSDDDNAQLKNRCSKTVVFKT